METPGRIAELERKFGENPRRYFAALANEYRKNGEVERAIELCESHLSEQRNHLSGHVVLAQALVDAGRDETAWGPLHTALDLDPENFIALRLLGELSARAGDPAQARAYFFRALEIEPRNEQLLDSLKALSPRVELPPPPPPAARPEGFEATSLAASAELEVSDAEPKVAEAEPEVEEAEPEVAEVEPEVAEVEPEVAEVEPEVAEVEPEVAEVEPEVAEVEPEAAEAEPEPIILLRTDDDLPETAERETEPEAGEQEETLPLSVAAEAAAEPEPTPVEPWPEWEPDAPAVAQADAGPDEAEPAFTVDLTEATEWWAGEPPQAAVQEQEAGAAEADSGAPQEGEPEAAGEETESRPTLVSETMVGLYLSQGHTALAIAALRDLVATRPDDERLRARLQELEDVTPRERRETVRDMFARLGRARSRPRETATALADAFAAAGGESVVARFFGDSAPPAGEPANAALAAAVAPMDETPDAAAFERWLTELRTS